MTIKYVRLENDKVVEILETDEKIEDLFHPSLKWVACSRTDVTYNYILVGGQWLPPSPEGVSADVERQWRNFELIRADEELNKVQDADPKAKGTVTQWREYRRSLRQYPESEGFTSGNRPVSP